MFMVARPAVSVPKPDNSNSSNRDCPVILVGQSRMDYKSFVEVQRQGGISSGLAVGWTEVAEDKDDRRR